MVLNIFPRQEDVLNAFIEAQECGEVKIYDDPQNYPKSIMVFAKRQSQIESALRLVPGEWGKKKIKKLKSGQNLVVRFQILEELV